MADIRIKDFATEAPAPAADDYFEIDGATNGSRKLAGRVVDNTGRAPRGGIVSAGTSAVGVIPDNTAWQAAAYATGNITFGKFVRFADWTPSSGIILFQKIASNLGLILDISTTGTIRVAIGTGSTYTYFSSPSVNTVPDGSLGMIAITIDRAGNATFYVNAVSLGSVPISSLSAQTIANTGSAYWLSNGISFHSAGTQGEDWIIFGLLTASRIADINRAGSIAPFCVMTPNSVTGQNTATIDGLSFICWPEFERADPTNNPIAPDRSGNGQHAIIGASGLFPAVRHNWVNQRPRSSALVGDGSNGLFRRNTLNAQNPGTGEVVLAWEGIYPQFSDSTDRRLNSLTSSTADTSQARAVFWRHETTYGLSFVLYGATTADYRFLSSLALHNHLVALGARGIVTQLIAARNSSGIRLSLGIGRDGQRFYDVTKLFSEQTSPGGTTPPAWTDQIDGQYLVGFYRNSTVSSAHVAFPDELWNVAPSEAELRANYIAGETLAKWASGSKVALNSSACVDIDYGAGFTGASATGFTAAVASGNHFAKAQPAFGVVPSQIVRVTGTLTLNNGKTIIPQARLTSSNPVSLGAAGSFSIDLVSLVGVSNSSINFDTTGDADYTISSLSCTKLGVTTRARIDGAAPGVVPNDRYENGSSDFTTSLTGITISPEPLVGARATIRNNFAHSAISTLPGTTVLGTLPANWGYVEEHANVINALDAGITISTGTSGTPGRFTNALPVSTTGPKAQASQQLAPQSTTSNTTLYISKSASSTVGDLLPVNAVIERKY